MLNSRRQFLSALGATGAATLVPGALPQGVVPRKTQTAARGQRHPELFGAKLSDVAALAGLHAPTIFGSPEKHIYILEAIGCGCAFFDYDNDGWLDLFVLSGTILDGRPDGATNRLYRNNRDGTFTDVTVEAGLHRTGWAYGVCVGDTDNNGYEDLFITYWGQNVLYRNNGDGTFTDISGKALPPQEGTRWGTGCTFLDYDRDGNLDLFVANYLGFDRNKAPLPGTTPNCRFSGMAVNCGPHGFPFGAHSLYRNDGKGVFTDVSRESGILKAQSSYGLTAIAADLDDDGWPDIYVACDSTPSLLFLNNHNGTFREEGVLRGVAYSGDGQEQAGMGVAAADLHGSGRLDLLKTHFADDLPILYRNTGRGEFEEATRKAGLAVDNRFVCWGAGFEDFDNDGNLDLFVSTGHVYPEVERQFAQYPAKSPQLLFRGLDGGLFEELLPSDNVMPSQTHNSRGCAFGDFDNDGDMDIAIVNLNEPPSLLRTDVISGHHWIKVRLVGRVSNRSAIGARVYVTTQSQTQMRERMSAGSYLSSNDPRLHFGLGVESHAEIRVRWPSGKQQRFSSQMADRLVTIDELNGLVPNAGWESHSK